MSTTAFHTAPSIEWAFAGKAVAGQTVSGDLHLVRPFASGVLVAVVDGLGHGDDATLAARTAIDVLRDNADQPVIKLVEYCHHALAKTRGAVMTLASFHPLDASLSWLSVGNVAGLLLRADPRATPAFETAMPRGGVVGYQLPLLRAQVVTVSRGDLLILASDGIRDGFEQGVASSHTPQQIADRILSRHFKGTDDGLALVARYLGGDHE